MNGASRQFSVETGVAGNHRGLLKFCQCLQSLSHLRAGLLTLRKTERLTLLAQLLPYLLLPLLCLHHAVILAGTYFTIVL
jgi:hypothetical protein